MSSSFEHIAGDRYKHQPTGLPFTLLPAGTFTMGMAESEAQLLESRPTDIETEFVVDFLEEFRRVSRPTMNISVSSFLIADFPLDVPFVTTHWGFQDLQFADRGAAFIPGSADVVPLLEDIGLRLPSEAEWEYCHRRCSSTDQLPGEEAVRMESDGSLCGFGSWAELCADSWAPTLSGIPEEGVPRVGDGPRTVRGGAANLYPWQGCGEWLELLPFYRLSEANADLLSVRPAASV